MDNIFKRYYRVDKSRSEVAGTGLGLSIVKAIVNAHEGRLEVESKFGKGSKFTVHLPVDP
jgi:two-component system phosphate regulon sensor histidine kinase PhoR